MRLDSITLCNYRKFKETQVSFPKGVVAIIGRNGAGKSTLMEAAAWVLYGNKSPIARAGKDTIRNVNAPTNQPVSVELMITIADQEYRVFREMRGKNLTSNGRVSSGGVVLAEGAEKLDEFIIKLLGLDYQGFFASVFARQKELNAFSGESLSDRQKLIIRMLGIDSIDGVIKRIGGDVREMRARLEEKRRFIYDEDGGSLVEKIRTKISEMDTEFEKLVLLESREQELYSGLKKEFELIRTERISSKGYKQRYDLLQRDSFLHNSRLNDFREKSSKLTFEIEQLKESEDELVDVNKKLNDMADVRDRLGRLEKQAGLVDLRRNMGQKLTELKGRRSKSIQELKEQTQILDRDAVNQEINVKKRDCERQELEIRELEKHIGRLRADISNHKSRIDIYLARSKDVQKLGPESICPTCERPLGETCLHLKGKYDMKIKIIEDNMGIIEKEADDSGFKIKALAENKLKFESEISELQKRIDRINEKEKVSMKIRERLRGQNEQIRVSQADLDNLEVGEYDETAHEEFRSKYRELQEIEQLSSSLERNVYRLSHLRAEGRSIDLKIDDELSIIDDLEVGLNELDFDLGRHYELEKMEKEMTYELNTLEKALSKIKWNMDSIGKSLFQERERLMDMNKWMEEINDLEENLLHCQKLRNIMKVFKVDLISRIRPILSNIASDYFRQLTQGRYSRLEIDENYEIFIYDGNNPFPVARFSGGEEDIANLSLRLAISTIIAATKKKQGLQLIVLDEIFGSQDDNRRQNILNSISNLLKRFQQVFIITHIDQVKEHIGNVVMVEEETDGNSKIVST